MRLMYRTIDAAFWTDPHVKHLTPDGRLLLLYLITNPHTHVSGIYYLPRILISSETGLSLRSVNTLCDTLSGAGFCRFDAERDVIWVKNMMRYQGRGDKNVKSAAHHIIEDLHKTPLIHEFLDSYPEVKAVVGDRVSVGYPEKSVDATPGSRSLNPDSRIQKTETPEPRIPYGEFLSVLLTEDEHAKLKARMNGNLGPLIDELDRYSQTDPRAFKKYKNHYAVLLNWGNRKGLIKTQEQIEEETRQVQEIRRIFRKGAQV